MLAMRRPATQYHRQTRAGSAYVSHDVVRGLGDLPGGPCCVVRANRPGFATREIWTMVAGERSLRDGDRGGTDRGAGPARHQRRCDAASAALARGSVATPRR